jgi:fructose-bisphosphate aldolase class II
MQPENSKDLDFRRFLLAATKGMQAICRARFEAFGSAGRATAIKPMGCDKMAERYRSGELSVVIR